MKNNENGRSMVEMLGVLAIIGVLSAGGLAGYSKAMYKYRVNETMNQLTMIVSNIRTLFGSQNTYEGLTTAHAKDYGIVTADMFTEAVTADTDKGITGSPASIMNPFKGAVTINSVGGRTATDNEAFVIEYTNLPAEACVTIVTSDWGASAGSGLIAIAAHNGASATLNGTHTGTALTASSAFATSGAGATASTIAITAADSAPFTIAQAVDACNPATAGGDTSANASIALKYY